MRDVALLIHGGGPTAVLNASLAGLALECRRLAGFPDLWAARHGLDGFFASDWLDLSAQPESLLQSLLAAPGSAIGSSRYPMRDEDFARAVSICRDRRVRIVFLTGGNGTMRCAARLHQAAGDALQVIGIPKTIDNDIPGMDHTPGYASVARFFAHAARDLGADNRALPSPVTILETLGRDTGWVTASTVLARSQSGDAPHLIYLPERPLTLGRICQDIQCTLDRLGRCVVAICEGQRDENGQPFGADVPQDRDGVPRLASNLGHTLALLVSRRLGIRARSEKPGLVGRCFAATASAADRAEAELCGRHAVRVARAGQSGVMVALHRQESPAYSPVVETVPLADGLRHFPQPWIAEGGNDVTSDFVQWLFPLTGPIESWPTLLQA